MLLEYVCKDAVLLFTVVMIDEYVYLSTLAINFELQMLETDFV